MTRLVREGEPNDKPGAEAGVALGPDLSAERLHQLARDREPEASAAVLAGGRALDLPELVEDRLQLIARDAGTAIDDHALSAGVGEAPAHLDGAPHRRELDCVAEHIHEH